MTHETAHKFTMVCLEASNAITDAHNEAARDFAYPSEDSTVRYAVSSVHQALSVLVGAITAAEAEVEIRGRAQ